MNKRLCFVVSSEITVKAFLLDHLKLLQNHYDISLVLNTSNTRFLEPYGIHVQVFSAPLQRRISLPQDMLAFFMLCRLFATHRFDIVHSLTPKAGLLAMVTAFLMEVPARIHTFTGQVWATRSGFKRWPLKHADRVIATLATRVLADSPSQLHFLVNEGIASMVKACVLVNGSVGGVDTHRFRPDPQTRAQLRAEMKIPDEAVVLLYLGRLSVEKGVLDLAHAFTQSCQSRCNAHLMIVGPDEENLAAKILDICSTMRHFVHLQSYTETPERFMAAADVFCLPSYREGFGNVIIEAACVGIPAIGSRIYGITDAIVEGQTGLLHTVGDRDDLARSITRLMEHGDLRLDLGRNAQLRAARLFNKDMLTCALLDFYRSL